MDNPQVAITKDYLWQRAQQELLRDDFSFFVLNANLSLDNQPFSFNNHEYLQEYYEALADPNVRELVAEKAAQMGITVAELLWSFHGMRYGRLPKGLLYLLPTEHHMQRVSQTKIQPIIDENPLFQTWIEKTDSVAQKRIGQSNLIFHGMGSRLGLKSYSVDGVIFDEIEEIEDWSHVPLAEERMSHSSVSWCGRTIDGGVVHRLSVPSIPGYGIDAYFSGSEDVGIRPSDQRFRLFKCGACNEYTCFEDEFPDCIVEINAKEEKAIRVCKKCGRELNLADPEVRRRAQWVAKEPERSVRGYHFSQLFSRYVNPWKILDQFRKKRELTTLFNDKLGIPYVDAESRLEIKDLTALETSDLQLNAFPGPAGMGVDQPKDEGGKFHVTIGYRTDKQPCNIIRITIRNKWNELGDFMNQFNVGRCVVDGLPDQDKAREFAKAFPGRVFLCYYAEKQKGAAKWNENDWTVSVDRTESLNSSTRAVHEQKISIPRLDDEVKLFERQCHNLARKKQEDKDSGSVRQIWVKTGADHFRHAYNYLYLALPEIGEYVPPKKESDWLRRDRRGRERNWKTL